MGACNSSAWPRRHRIGVTRLPAGNASADCRSLQSHLHGVFQLFGRQIRKLQSDRAICRKAPFGAVLHHLRELLILEIDEPCGQIALGPVPERIDAHYLNVDAFLIHDCEACFPERWIAVSNALQRRRASLFKSRSLQEAPHFRHVDVAMHINRLDSLPAHHDRLVLRDGSTRLLRHRSKKAASTARAYGRRRRAGHGLQKLSAISHGQPVASYINRTAVGILQVAVSEVVEGDGQSDERNARVADHRDARHGNVREG